MARPKKVSSSLSGRDRTRDVASFKLEPLKELPKFTKSGNSYEKEFYVKIGQSLVYAKQLRDVDLPSLEVAAFYYAACQIAMDEMRKPEGLIQLSQNGFKQASPYVAVLEKSSKMLQMFADRYGLNLTGATKIPKAKSDRNSLEDMLTR